MKFGASWLIFILSWFCLIPSYAEAANGLNLSLPDGINIQQYITTHITSTPFTFGRVAGIVGNDITPWFGPAPDCSEAGTAPQLEIFLVNKDQCIVKDDSITFKILIRNLGQQDAYNVHLLVEWPITATLINGNLPNPFVGIGVPGNTILEFHNDPSDVGVFQALLSNNGTVEYTFTLHIDEADQPFTVNAKLVYYSCGGRKSRYTCLQNCQPPCIRNCEEQRTQCKNTCTDERNTCGNNCSNSLGQCNNDCAAQAATCNPLTTDCVAQNAACTANCASQNNICIGSCDAAKQRCDGVCDDNYNTCQNNCTTSCEKTCDQSIESATSLTINGSCETPNIPPTPLPSKQPAIICGPGEPDCVNSMPNLGVNFKSAKSWLGNEDYLATRFARFRDAIMSIVPGECSVISDYQNIILPPFHDSLNREAKPAADFMMPLYNSGQDFVKLVHENELLGLKHKIAARARLNGIHQKFWRDLHEAIDDVLSKAQTSGSLRNSIDGRIQNYQQQVQDAQQDLTRSYQQMQQERLGKFDPVAEAAINNAKQSICRACPSCGSDGGLGDILPDIKQAYQQSLDSRTQTYTQTQAMFFNESAPDIPAEAKKATWKPRLLRALDDFDAGNPSSLQSFILEVINGSDQTWEISWQGTYEVHATDDRKADENVRQNHWKKALDAPKAIAAKCEADKTFAAPIETSWCESNGYPEFVIKGAPHPVKDVHPPVAIEGGETTRIYPSAVLGTVCGGGPGDPYWADDCSCHCDEVIVCADGGVAKCGGCGHPITQDDIYITSQKECFLSKKRPYTMGAGSYPPSSYDPPEVR